jgi:hypothetical protein
MKHLQLLLRTSIFVLLLSGCQKTLTEQITEDLYLNMNVNSFFAHQVEVQFVNTNHNLSPVQPDVTVQLTDPQGLVYDLNGNKQPKVDGQFVNLAVSPAAIIPDNSPVTFTLKATAPGFLPVEQEVNVTSADSMLSFIVPMIEIARPPAGVTVSRSPSGADIVEYDVARQELAASIPSLSEVNLSRAVRNGAPEENFLKPIGYIRVNAANAGAQDVSMQIATNLVDPLDGSTIVAKEEVDIYHRNPNTQAWEYESTTTLEAVSARNLKASFKVNENGEWIATARAVVRNCSGRLGLRFTRSSQASTLHFIEVVNDANNAVLLTANEVTIRNGGFYDFTQALPQGVNIKVRVYQFEQIGSTNTKGVIVRESASIPSCNFTTSNRLTLEVNPQKVTSRPVARFELDTYCAQSKLVYYHEGRVQYRLAGTTSPFIDLGLATKSGRLSTETVNKLPGQAGYVNTPSFSFLETDRLEWNKLYEFRTTINGRHKTTRRNITLSYYRNRTFKQAEHTQVAAPGNVNFPGGSYLFARGYWFSPEFACADFGY